ncbi:hypothetical protein EG68_01000 [Paragonimus skrjabini miyazakii]|uniref:Uncharacterized protein n=1 Tax=Paragonimus skrjabini miyazakii TaxID=59628 RepID=A0A8S9Z281_9TREM|nr:hypothetical protein EG68_01000 [Paragonimus skrjabini miyazakii]
MAGATTEETEFDVCEKLEKPSRLMKLRQEMEQKLTLEQDTYSRGDKPSELVRRRSSANTRRASIRRTSMREKKLISWKEAKQEAEMLGLSPVTLRLNTEAGTSDAEVLMALNEMTSPVEMNTANSSDSLDPTSKTDGTSLGNLSEQIAPIDSANSVKGSNNSLELTSHLPANSSTNDQTRHSNGAKLPQIASSSPKSERSTYIKPPCTEKVISDGEILDTEHKSSHGPIDVVSSQYEKSPANPISQVCPNQNPMGTVEVHTSTNLCLVPRSHVQSVEQSNNHVRDSGIASSLLLTNAHSEPLIVCSLPQSDSTNCRQSIGSSTSNASESDHSSPELSTYSKYFPPRPTQVNDSRTNSTKKEDTSFSLAVRTKQKSMHSLVHSMDSLCKKTNKELIECDSHPRSSVRQFSLICLIFSEVYTTLLLVTTAVEENKGYITTSTYLVSQSVLFICTASHSDDVNSQKRIFLPSVNSVLRDRRLF